MLALLQRKQALHQLLFRVESSFTVSISPTADAASITVPDSSTPIQILEYTGSGDYEAIALNSSVVPANEDEALSIFVAVQKNGLNVATLLNGPDWNYRIK